MKGLNDFSQIVYASLVDAIIKQIRELIMAGQLKTGAALLNHLKGISTCVKSMNDANQLIYKGLLTLS